MSYTKPDGTTIMKGYGLFSKEAQTNATAFLIHHKNADLIVMHEETKMPVRAEYHFMDFSAGVVGSQNPAHNREGLSN